MFQSSMSLTDTRLMQILVRIILLTAGMLFSFNTLAEVVLLPRAANVRSSKIFYGRNNLIDQLPQGAQVEIVSRRKLPSGANSLEINIIGPTDKLSLNEKKPIYIWQSKDEIKDDLFKTESGAVCTNCNSEPVKAPAPTDDIKNIVNKIEEQQSEDPTLALAAKQIEIEDAEPQDASTETPPATPLTGPLADKIQAYSNSPQVAKMIQWSKDHPTIGRKKNGDFDGYCYRHVKEAMATKTRGGKGEGNNLVPKWYPSGNAVTAGKDLKTRGFINLLDTEPYKTDLKNPKNVPKGAIMIYSTTNHSYGHAEVKLDDETYYFGIISKNSKATRKDYKLLGVWIKDPL